MYNTCDPYTQIRVIILYFSKNVRFEIIVIIISGYHTIQKKF